MMNNIYLIKIGNREFPIAYMARDSWKCTPDAREVKKYVDGNGKEHIHETLHGRTSIEFQIEEHAWKDHLDIVSYFQTLNNVNVTYLNDRTGTYDSGVFRIDAIQWRHKKTFGHDIWYDKTNITMKEY